MRSDRIRPPVRVGPAFVAAVVVVVAAAIAHAYDPLVAGETAPVADAVFGQPDFTSTGAGNGLTNFNRAGDVTFDSSGVMYVTDINNDRVLVFVNQSDTVADTVVGGPLNGTGNDRLNNPYRVAVWDGPETSILFVSDFANNRVLGYITRSPSFGGVFFPDTTADYVFGQPSFTTSGFVTTATGLHDPTGIAILDTGSTYFSLFVGDRGNNRRVLRFDVAKNLMGSAFDAIDTTADYVWGQPDFISGAGGLSATAINSVEGIAVTPDRLYICDNVNRRVVVERLDDADTVFDAVYGQPDFTSGVVGTDTYGIDYPWDIALPPSRRFLAISDYNNDRVLIYSDTTGADTAADYVIGDTDLIATTHALTSETYVTGPAGLAFQSETILWVASYDQYRVLRFDDTTPAAETALPVSAVVTSTTGTATVTPTATTTESYVQVNLSGGTTTAGDSTTLTTTSTTAAANGSYSTAGYTETFPLANATDDTVVMPIWTNQTSLRTFVALRSDTGSLRAASLPSGISNTETGLRAFGATIVLLEFSDSAGRLIGDSVTTRFIGDSIAYALRYLLSETTVARYRALGFETAAGSGSFRLWYADTYGGAWTQDTTVTITVRAASAPWNLEIVVSGITKDLPGGLGGVSSSSAAADDGGLCVFARWGLPAPLLGWLRNLRDLLLASGLGRITAALYYALSGVA